MNNGIEVRQRLSLFTTSCSRKDGREQALRHGQDLCCANCINLMFLDMRNVEAVGCDGCGEIKLAKKFNAEMLQRWKQSLENEVYCMQCCGERTEEEYHFCYGSCMARLPEHHFVSKVLNDCLARKTLLNIKYARCTVATAETGVDEKHECKRCGAMKHIKDFGPPACK